MAELLREGPRLILRRAAEEDIDYICALQEDADNRDYIVPFTREEHTIIVTQAKAAIDIIVEERGSGARDKFIVRHEAALPPAQAPHACARHTRGRECRE